MNIAEPSTQRLAKLWPRIDARIKRVRDPHPLQTSLPPAKLSEVDRLGVGEAAIVNGGQASRLHLNAVFRRPGARYRLHPKGEKHTIIERVA